MSANSTASFTSHLLHSSLYINLSLQPHCLISAVIMLGCGYPSFFCYNNYSALEIVVYSLLKYKCQMLYKSHTMVAKDFARIVLRWEKG